MKRKEMDEHHRNIDLKRVDRRMRLDEFNLKREELENREPLPRADLHLKDERNIHNFRKNHMRRDPPVRTFIKDGVKVQEQIDEKEI